MTDLCGRGSLALEALGDLDFPPLHLMGDLDRDAFANAGVVALVDTTHGAFAD